MECKLCSSCKWFKKHERLHIGEFYLHTCTVSTSRILSLKSIGYGTEKCGLYEEKEFELTLKNNDRIDDL